MLLERRAVRKLLASWSREVVRSVAREVLEDRRALIREQADAGSATELLRDCELALLDRMEELAQPRLRRVLNATGVLLHTNLGRARTGAAVAAEMARVADAAVELEVDLASNRRGGRSQGVEDWLIRLTGAEAAAVANNGAAALWLAVRSQALGGAKVCVSRGEQVAIGGSFRMPELIRTTGAKMCEVGTTNRTRLKDYAQVVATGDVVLKVHPSNYRIVGFTEEVDLKSLATLCREREATLIFDAGSGSLYNFGRFGLAAEPTISGLLATGADLITCSADKLLGGPQAGLILGRAAAVERCRKHPLMRALRLDKTILAGLEATLLAYARTASGGHPALPLFDALQVKAPELRRRAQGLLRMLEPSLAPLQAAGWKSRVVRSSASMGAGSLAEDPIASVALEIQAPGRRQANALHRILRTGRPAVLARIDDERIGLDLRAVDREELEELGRQVAAGLAKMSGSASTAGKEAG